MQINVDMIWSINISKKKDWLATELLDTNKTKTKIVMSLLAMLKYMNYQNY